MEGTFLYTLPQWFVFSAILVVVYGWVENKKVFRMIGLTILILLGVYALWAILGDSFAARKYLTPDEIARQELDNETIDELPFVARLLPAYLLFVISGVTAIPTLYFTWKEKKISRIFIVVSLLLCMTGFFIIVSALRTL